jgi:hypothetical protein
MASRVFTAQYRSMCAECGDTINPGEDVRYDEHDRLVHWMCPDDPDLSVGSATPCPKCFLVHSGECF